MHYLTKKCYLISDDAYDIKNLNKSFIHFGNPLETLKIAKQFIYWNIQSKVGHPTGQA